MARVWRWILLSALAGCNGILGIEHASIRNDAAVADAPQGCDAGASDPRNCGACGHDCFRGDCTAGKCQPYTLYSDVKGASVGTGPTGITVDATHVYWTHYAAGAIRRIPKDGGGSVETLATNEVNAGPIAVDADAVYFATNLPMGHVVRVPLVAPTTPLQLAGGQYYIDSLAVDDAYVYWQTHDGSLQRVPKAGGAAPTTLWSGQGFFWSISLRGADVFWGAEEKREIRRGPKVGGGSPTTIASNILAPILIAADDDAVYYTARDDNRVERVAITDGATQDLATNQPEPFGIAIDATYVYFTALGGGVVVRVPKAGGAVTAIASGEGGPLNIAVDADRVYWTNWQDGRVRAVAK